MVAFFIPIVILSILSFYFVFPLSHYLAYSFVPLLSLSTDAHFILLSFTISDDTRRSISRTIAVMVAGGANRNRIKRISANRKRKGGSDAVGNGFMFEHDERDPIWNTGSELRELDPNWKVTRPRTQTVGMYGPVEKPIPMGKARVMKLLGSNARLRGVARTSNALGKARGRGRTKSVLQLAGLIGFDTAALVGPGVYDPQVEAVKPR